MNRTAAPYLFISPFFILYSVFMVFPLIDSVWTSLHFQRTLESSVFVGLFNYGVLLSDTRFWLSLIHI